MGAPKLKVYLLPEGYAQTNDTDVQYSVGDELLPVVGKTEILSENIEVLTGVVPYENAAMVQFDLTSGRQSYNLSAPDGSHAFYWHASFPNFMRGPIGTLEFRVLDVDNAVVDPARYFVVTDLDSIPVGISFTGVVPASPKVSAYLKSTNTGKWALPGDKAYQGTNSAFNRVLLSVDSASITGLAIPEGTNKEYLTLTGTPTSVKATMWGTSTKTRYFCGSHNNWVGDHLDMWPDIFVGLIDYPGDRDVDQNGDPLPDELKPGYIEIGQYQLNYRDGIVTFPAEIDTTELNDFDKAKLVRANYAYLVGIDNVSSQKLDQIAGTGGKNYKATSETLFPASHGRRWIGRNDRYTPLNVYVKGPDDTVPQLTPTPVRVLPWEQLTVKTTI